MTFSSRSLRGFVMNHIGLPVREIDERLHGGRVHALTPDLDLVLATLGHVVGEHGVKVGHSRRQNDSVSSVRVVAHLE